MSDKNNYTNGHNNRRRTKLRPGIKAAGSTATGAGIGVIGGITGIAVAAAGEVILPVALCLWATGLTGGAIGLLLGLPGKEKE